MSGFPKGGTAGLVAGAGITLTPPSTVGVTPGTFDAQHSLAVSAKDAAFGAKGDGATDDTVAIQAALDFAKQASNVKGGAEVLLPYSATPYVITQITIPGGVRLRGAGYGSVLLAKSGNTLDMVVLENTAYPQVDIQDVVVDGNKAVNTSGTYRCIVLTPASYGAGTRPGPFALPADIRCQRVFVVNSPAEGWNLGPYVRGAQFVDCRAYFCNTFGWIVQGTDNFWLGGESALNGQGSALTAGSGGGGVNVVAGATSNAFVGFKAWGSGINPATSARLNACDGFYIQAGNMQLSACQSQDNGRHGYSTQDGVHGLVMKGCEAGFNFAASFGWYGGTNGLKSSDIEIMTDSAGSVFVPQEVLYVDSGAVGANNKIKLMNSQSGVTSWVLGTVPMGNDVELENSRGGIQNPAFAATITPDPTLGYDLIVGPLTAGITFANPAAAGGNPSLPSGSQVPGQRLRIQTKQDGTGGRTTSFGTAYHGVGAVTPSTTASTITVWDFRNDGVNGWILVGFQTGLT